MPGFNLFGEGASVVEISSSTTITTANKAGILYAFWLRPGTTASALTFQNGGSGGTTLAGTSHVGVTAAGDITTPPVQPAVGMVFSTDIYATIAGTGAKGYAVYKQIG